MDAESAEMIRYVGEQQLADQLHDLKLARTMFYLLHETFADRLQLAEVSLLAVVPIQAAVASPRHFTITEVSESCCKNKRDVVASVPVHTVFTAVLEESPPQALTRAATDAAKVISLKFICRKPFNFKVISNPIL